MKIRTSLSSVKAIFISLILLFFVFILTSEKVSDQKELAKYRSYTIEYNLKEISGLTISNKINSLLYAIEDSGNGTYVSAITETGKKAGRIKLKHAKNKDWEDISIGPGPQKGLTYLYIADIGDNYKRRNHLSIYRIKEPDFKTLSINNDLTAEAEEIKLKYPEGKYDAEAFLTDPANGTIYIATKQVDKSVIFKTKPAANVKGIYIMKQVARIPYGGITAGAISKKRNLLVLKNRDEVFCWKLKRDELPEKALQSKPVKLPYLKETQGEAICFDAIGKGYFTTSELRKKGNPELRYYKLPLF